MREEGADGTEAAAEGGVADGAVGYAAMVVGDQAELGGCEVDAVGESESL